jgi:hypothetical protein
MVRQPVFRVVSSDQMDAIWFEAVGWSILALCCVLMGLFGTDSRPGFANGRTDVKERWFVHSRDDYR